MAVGAGMRLAAGVPLAGVVTIGLFMLMRGLIFTDEVLIEEARELPNFEITKQIDEIEVMTRDNRPDQPPEVPTPPPPPRIEAAKSQAPQEGLASMLGRLPEIQPQDVGSGDIQFVVADRDIQPLVRMEPMYPRRAAERGLEGTCTMYIDVNPDGTTTNVQADCTNNVFARAAVRAVERWKYAPKMQDGQAVMRFGVQTDLVFQLVEE